MNSFINKWKTYLNEMECKLRGYTLGKQRQDQPQISYDQIQHFIIYLRESGIQSFKRKLPVMDLKPSQETVEWDKVKALMNKGYNGLTNGAPIFVSKDGYILDGTHRWAALKQIDPHAEIECWELQTSVEEGLTLMKRFANTENDHNNVRDTTSY